MARRCLTPPFLLALLAIGCTKQGELTLHGAVQKGPFVVGSSIELSLLDAQLNPTGQVFNTQTVNDRGEFDIAFSSSGPVALKGVGFYYNEISGSLSTASITLRAFYVPSGTGRQSAYVNLVTHLTTQRIMALVRQGTPFVEAVAQAETELRQQLGLTPSSYQPALSGIEMNLAGGDDDDNAYLLAVSSVLAKMAADRGGSLDANLQELLNGTAIDLEDGTLSPELKSQVQQAARTLPIRQVAELLATRLSETGSTAEVPDMNRVLDQDGDGLANRSDNCPLHPNHLQENGDGDGQGDACDPCPETQCERGCLPRDAEAGRSADLCVSPCGSDADCEAGARCALPPAPSTPGVCALPCDPLASACSAPLGCYLAHLASIPGGKDGTPSGGDPLATSTQRFVCAPAVLFGTAAEGDACPQWSMPGAPAAAPVSCGPGLACVRAPGDVFTCTRPCNPAQPACDGQACETPPGGDFSVCALPPGQRDDPCDQGTCAAPLTCVEAMFGCPEGLPRCCKSVGSAGEPCDKGGTCNAGLSCVGEGCPGTSAMRGPCCLATGGADQPCHPDGQCNQGEGLVCVGGPPGYCPNGAGRCCKRTGGPNQPCDSAGSCQDGLSCTMTPSCTNAGPCCVAVGGPGEPCDAAGACKTEGYVCGNSTTCNGAGMMRCCVPAGGDRQPCLPNRTCSEPTLGCSSGPQTGNLCGGPECCLLTGDLYQACGQMGACKDPSLGCGPAPAGQSCLYGLEQCCVPVGGEGEPCRQTPMAGMQCDDSNLSCVSSPACPGGRQCCQKSGGLGQPCRTSDPSSQCDPGLACQWASGGAMISTCVAAGGLGQPCRPWAPGASRCDTGLSCSNQPGVPESCVAAGGQGEPCLENGTCDEAYLACGPSATCPSGSAAPCCYRIPSGAKDQPCGPADACNTSLQCTSLACPNGLTKCCEPPFPACVGGTCSAPSSTCIESVQCAPNSSCCVPSGNERQPCTIDGQCNASLVCATSTACPGGLGRCCMAAGGVDQPCLSGSACTSGFCVASPSCPNGLAECCKPAPACTAGGTCNEAGRVCAFSSKCSSGAMVDQCCVPFGARGQACGPQHTCGGAPLECVQDPAQCSAGLQECCLEPGAAGQPCAAGDACNAGLTCFSNLPQGSCSPGSPLSKCCLPAGAQGERCLPGGTCSGDLVCLSPWAPGTPSQCSNPAENCCKAVPTGGMNEACGAADSCDSGLSCQWSDPMRPCPMGLSKCCY